MAQEPAALSGPDLTQGIPLGELADGGKLVGHAGGEQVLLVRRGTEIFAIGAECTHYHGPLVDGLVVGDTVRCPWHHACFDLRTGEALRAPAFDPVAVLVGRAARRQDLRGREARAAGGDIRAARSRAKRPRKSSSSAAARPASPRPRDCGARASREASSC